MYFGYLLPGAELHDSTTQDQGLGEGGVAANRFSRTQQHEQLEPQHTASMVRDRLGCVYRGTTYR